MLVQRLDGGLGGDVPLDATVDTMLAELESVLNTQMDGQYLFAGTRSDAPRWSCQPARSPWRTRPSIIGATTFA